MKFRAILIAVPGVWPNLKQFLRVMKLSTIILFIGLLHASAKGYSQVTLDEKKATLEKVLREIEKQTNYVFIYDEDKLKVPLIEVSVNNVPVTKALDACFKDLHVSYAIVGNNIILKPAAPGIIEKFKSFFEGPVTIRGLITDTTGRPLRGATVFFTKRKTPAATALRASTPDGLSVVSQPSTVTVADGTTPLATMAEVTFITEDNGLFYLDAEEGDEIGISYIGYKTYTFTVRRNMSFLKVQLHAVITQLKGVVFQTGYQKLSSERATGSFSKPNMEIVANRSSTLDLVSRLEGQVPGLVLKPYTVSGYDYNDATGAKTQKSVIRGESSVRLGSTPLYVVNGVIVSDFSTLNLDDIADVTVLKDAAAAAIWGAKAANGVIVVATKTGTRNQGVKISYNGFLNFEGKPDFNYGRKRYLSSSQYIGVAMQLFDPVNFPYSALNSLYNYYGPIAPSQQVLYDQNQGSISAAAASFKLDSMAKIDNTSQIENLWYRNAYTTSHTISASGATGTYSVFASAGYTSSRAASPGQNSSSYKINLSQSFAPNDRFSFSLNVQLADNIYSSKSGLAIGPDVLPYQLLRDGRGNNVNLPFLSGWTPEVIKKYADLSGIDLGTYQPFDELNYVGNKTNSYAINVVGNTTIRLWKGLQYLGTYGYAVTPTNIRYAQDNKSYNYRKLLLNNTFAGDPPTYLIPADGEFYQSSNNNLRNWTVRNQLAYTYSGRKGNDVLSLQGGQEANESRTNLSQHSIYGYDPQLQTYPLLDYATLSKGVFGTVGGFGGGLQQPFSENEIMSRYSSYFALASYTLNRKYSVDASWRKDHSNLFGSDISAQNKPSYSFGMKWNLKNEAPVSSVKWLNALSLRGTYGITGNSPYVGAATINDILAVEQIANNYYPVIGGPAYQLQTPQNSKLSWEATHTTNIGLDFSVFNNRLTGMIEYYHKSTTDLLGSSPVNYFTGSTSSTTNIGDLVNNGVNINLNSVNLRATDFSWESGLVLGYNTNKLVKYQIPQSYERYPAYKLGGGAVIGYPLNAVFAYQYAGLNDKGYPQVRLKNGVITSAPNLPTGDDLVYLGTTAAKVSGGVSNRFRYKQFHLFVNMYYSLGGVMRRDVNRFYTGMMATSNNLNGNLNVDFLERWQKTGDEKKTDIPGYLAVEDYNDRNTQFYTNADINVVSSSYLKLSEASLTCDLAPAVLRWLQIQSASLRLQLNNVLLWKANPYGINPEFQDPVYGGRPLPVNQHTVTLGANINF